MTFEEAFRKVSEVKEIEPVPNCSYLYEIEGEGIKTEEQVIEYAERLQESQKLNIKLVKKTQEPQKLNIKLVKEHQPTKEELAILEARERSHRPAMSTQREQTSNELVRIRQDRNLTQKELAQKSGVSIQAIRNYEQGVKPIESVQYSILKKLAGALECSVEDIVGKG